MPLYIHENITNCISLYTVCNIHHKCSKPYLHVAVATVAAAGLSQLLSVVAVVLVDAAV